MRIRWVLSSFVSLPNSSRHHVPEPAGVVTKTEVTVQDDPVHAVVAAAQQVPVGVQ